MKLFEGIILLLISVSFIGAVERNFVTTCSSFEALKLNPEGKSHEVSWPEQTLYLNIQNADTIMQYSPNYFKNNRIDISDYTGHQKYLSTVELPIKYNDIRELLSVPDSTLYSYLEKSKYLDSDYFKQDPIIFDNQILIEGNRSIIKFYGNFWLDAFLVELSDPNKIRVVLLYAMID